MSVAQKPKLYLLNLYPGTVSVTVTGQTKSGSYIVTTGNPITYILGPYKYVDISSLISSYKDGVQISAPDAGIPQAGILGFPDGVPTITLIIDKNNFYMQLATPDDVLKSYLYSNILQNLNPTLAQAYQALLTLISDYASGKPLSQSALSNASSALQQIKNMLQNALQFENQASMTFEGVSALQQVYNNLTQIYESLTNKTLTVGALQSLQLPSYSTPEASAIASDYSQFLNNAINIMQSASSSSSSPTATSSSTPPSSSLPTSSSTSTPSSTPPSSPPPVPTSSASTSTSSSSSLPSTSASTPTAVSSSSPTTTPTSSSVTPPASTTSPATTTSKRQLLAQIQAGDISSLLSGASQIPQDMIPVVNAVIQLYQLYGIPDGTPLSTAVERLLSDIRDAYYKISNHKQEEVNTQKISQLLQIYNALASSGLAPPSQSASKLNELVKTSGTIPALPAVLGQSYPGRVYSNAYGSYI